VITNDCYEGNLCALAYSRGFELLVFTAD